ncbi:MAG: hypothetical protein WDN06_03190 [Asticcacaulis sp.]
MNWWRQAVISPTWRTRPSIARLPHISGTPYLLARFPDGPGRAAAATEGGDPGGEAADQALLTALRERFPEAHLRHIYATTEAGTVLTVSDGLAAFQLRTWATIWPFRIAAP